MTTQDVSPFYKGLGSIVLVADIALLLFQGYNKHAFGLYDVLIQVVLGMVVLALIRPPFFEAAVNKISARFGKGE